MEISIAFSIFASPAYKYSFRVRMQHKSIRKRQVPRNFSHWVTKVLVINLHLCLHSVFVVVLGGQIFFILPGQSQFQFVFELISCFPKQIHSKKGRQVQYKFRKCFLIVVFQWIERSFWRKPKINIAMFLVLAVLPSMSTLLRKPMRHIYPKTLLSAGRVLKVVLYWDFRWLKVNDK